MKVKFLIAATILAFSAAAQAMPAKPAKCPGVPALKSIGLSKDVVIRDKTDKTWAVGRMKHKFDTRDDWTFVVGKIEADNTKEAYKKAASALKTLRFQQGPIAVQRYNRWACTYSNDRAYPAVAMTPSIEGAGIAGIVD